MVVCVRSLESLVATDDGVALWASVTHVPQGINAARDAHAQAAAETHTHTHTHTAITSQPAATAEQTVLLFTHL